MQHREIGDAIAKLTEQDTTEHIQQHMLTGCQGRQAAPHRHADEVLGQFWQEYAFTLESHGFTVETDFGQLHGTVEINLELLRRAFDNLYANLVKYAEPSKPIRIAYHREGNQVLLTITNTVSALRNRPESTNIGLNTCRRIFRMHDGCFETLESDGLFTVEIRLPVS